MKRATETPLATARIGVRVLEGMSFLVASGNPNTRCDAAVGAQLCGAAIRGAQYNVHANVSTLKDVEFAASCRAQAAGLAAEGTSILQLIDRAILPEPQGNEPPHS